MTNRVALSYRSEERAAPYCEALRAVGLEPVMLRLGSSVKSLDGVNGLLLPGGPDINPGLYRAKPHPATSQPDSPRDQFELQLMAQATDQNIPTLCICRGMQLLNVSRGGTLLQDIPIHFVPNRDDRSKAVHQIMIQNDTRLWAIVGEHTIQVNSRHHQTIDQLGNGLRISAVAPDGIIEAIETLDDEFFIGVQWHPEDQLHERANRLIFERFAQVVRGHHHRSYALGPNKSHL